MEAKNFRKSGHFPSFLSAFLYFDVSFMIWVLLIGTLTFYAVSRSWKKSWATAETGVNY
jgi:nitrate/nitrite transporter NarK